MRCTGVDRHRSGRQQGNEKVMKGVRPRMNTVHEKAPLYLQVV
jgi:hypothetical protein